MGSCAVSDHADRGEEDHVQRPSRWVLYDFDGDEVIGGAVYHDRSDAVADAAELNDVIVVPILVPQ